MQPLVERSSADFRTGSVLDVNCSHACCTCFSDSGDMNFCVKLFACIVRNF